MKVITIKEPWATLILEGYKEYAFKLENVKRIDQIEINGQLGFWNYNIEEK